MKNHSVGNNFCYYSWDVLFNLSWLTYVLRGFDPLSINKIKQEKNEHFCKCVTTNVEGYSDQWKQIYWILHFDSKVAKKVFEIVSMGLTREGLKSWETLS